MAVLFHQRLTRPILGMVLVVLGLSVILRDQNRNVIISSGMCLVLCGVFFASCYACKMLGDNEYVNPALAAWLPVLFLRTARRRPLRRGAYVIDRLRLAPSRKRLMTRCHPVPSCPNANTSGCSNSARISSDSSRRGPGRLKYWLPSARKTRRV